MIISFKYKFIFVKNYKTAGSSIETYLYNFLDSKDITAQTKEHKGINFKGNFDPKSLIENFEKETAMKYINNKMIIKKILITNNFFFHIYPKSTENFFNISIGIISRAL